MRKDLLFERLFGSNRSERLFDDEESSVASFVYDFAYDEIHKGHIHAGQDFGSDDFDTDSVESFDEKVESTMIRFERVAEVFKKSCKSRNSFLRSFGHWAPHCKKTIQSLRDIAEELKADKFGRDLTRAFGSVIGAIGGKLVFSPLKSNLTRKQFEKSFNMYKMYTKPQP
ncbi:hypothetical protein AVEN_257925-1 [Araneus ventricosus]|uniref:Uncharacterized protein n=1 Tax=Araneus ventricosus TaxID=182803 RepID=A0A4Y2WVC6_ARAVE|nr:hypothetical protein AVEN_257925-1 [Araneus ventricosus]